MWKWKRWNGWKTANDENCIKELKKGDVLTLCCDQYTSSNQTIENAKIAKQFSVERFIL